MNRERIGALLVRLRQSRGAHISQADLAELTGLDPGYISRMERGDRVPSLEVIARLAPGYGLSPAQLAAVLLGETGVVAAPPPNPLAAISLALRNGPWDSTVRQAILALLSLPDVERAQVRERFDQAVQRFYEAASGELDEVLLTSGPAGAAEWFSAWLTDLRHTLFEPDPDDEPADPPPEPANALP